MGSFSLKGLIESVFDSPLFRTPLKPSFSTNTEVPSEDVVALDRKDLSDLTGRIMHTCRPSCFTLDSVVVEKAEDGEQPVLGVTFAESRISQDDLTVQTITKLAYPCKVNFYAQSYPRGPVGV